VNAQQWVAGQAGVDEVDAMAIAAERKWGVGRLRLVVPLALRQKFDSQRVRLNDAIAGASNEVLAVECRRMCSAYKALDAAATAAGAQARPDAWEVVVDDDVILTFVRSDADAARFPLDGFKREVWGLDEVAKLIAEYPQIRAAKQRFGAHVESIRRAVEEPEAPQRAPAFAHVDLDDVFGKPPEGSGEAIACRPDPSDGFA